MTERASLPVLDRARCTGCGDCVPVCPAGVLALASQRLEFVKPDSCDYCGECEAVCNQGAISCPYDILVEGKGQSQSVPIDR
jgi:ferredoxin